ncbi:MAG: hypothetical protein WDM96_02900 [Lacunisphaera sp.]
MTRTDLYAELGGFDEGDFGVAYNDVDYCLRVRAAGRRVIYTPQAQLMHWGSATRGVTFDDAEHIAFVQALPGVRRSVPEPAPAPRGQSPGGPAAAVRTARAGKTPAAVADATTSTSRARRCFSSSMRRG